MTSGAQQGAWEQRDTSTEIVAHGIDLWMKIAESAIRDPQTHDALENYTRIAHWAVRHTADLARAIEIGTSALTTCERVLGRDHPDTLTSRNNLASAHKSAGDLAKAIPLYQDTLAARERVLGPDHPNTLTSRNNLAGAYQSAGDLAKAIPIDAHQPGAPGDHGAG